MADQGYKIGPVLADRVIATIKRVEAMPYRVGFSGIETRFEDSPYYQQGGEVRIGEISGSWLKGATKTVTLLKSDGTAVSPEETFVAKNWFSDISVDCGTRKVACAKVGDTWILIQAEC